MTRVHRTKERRWLRELPGAGALAAIQRVLARSDGDRSLDDPWGTYLDGSTPAALAQLAGVRALLFLTPEER